MGSDYANYHASDYNDMSEAEREQRTDDECEAADTAAHRLYRSPLADLITQTVNDLTAELESVAVKLPEFVQSVWDLDAAERDIAECNPLADFVLALDMEFGDEAQAALDNLNEAINGLHGVAEKITTARKGSG